MVLVEIPVRLRKICEANQNGIQCPQTAYLLFIADLLE